MSRQELGVVGICVRFLLQRSPRIERRPDLAFLRKERLPARPFPDLFPGAPDLVVEVLSPSDSIGNAAAKARLYLASGSTEVWSVDPEAQVVTVYRAGAPARPFGCGGILVVMSSHC